MAEDDHSLLAQLAQLKKEIPESMRDFVARFDKIVHKILVNRRPSDDNLKCFFINAMPAEISFFIRRQRVWDLATTKTTAIELEDDLINTGKWRREVQATNSQPSTSTTPSDPIIQRLVNDVITLKRQLPKANTSYPQPYQGIPRWPNN